MAQLDRQPVFQKPLMRQKIEKFRKHLQRDIAQAIEEVIQQKEVFRVWNELRWVRLKSVVRQTGRTCTAVAERYLDAKLIPSTLAKVEQDLRCLAAEAESKTSANMAGLWKGSKKANAAFVKLHDKGPACILQARDLSTLQKSCDRVPPKSISIRQEL
jgi:hypothetical protein